MIWLFPSTCILLSLVFMLCLHHSTISRFLPQLRSPGQPETQYAYLREDTPDSNLEQS